MRSIFGGCSIETIVNAMTVDEKVARKKIWEIL